MTVKVRDGDGLERTIHTIGDLIARLDGGALTKVPLTMSGESGVLVGADDDRKSVSVFNADTNDLAVIGLAGETVTLIDGVPIAPGGGIRITGTAAQSAMTQIGTAGQKLTVYVE